MQTLIDPYELTGPLSVPSRAPSPPPPAEPTYDGRATLVDLEIEWETVAGGAPEALPERLVTQSERDRASAARGPRIWSSDDER